ncbi:unnamed protein product [Discosporangium mesarthrocarpum]
MPNPVSYSQLTLDLPEWEPITLALNYPNGINDANGMQDFVRLALYTVAGGLYFPIVLHYWFGFLDRIAKSRPVSSRVKNKYGQALVQLSVDQTVGVVAINIGFYIFYTALVRASSGKLFPLSAVAIAARTKVQTEFWSMLKMNWRIWPAANFINFSLVPPPLRVLFSNLVAVLWNIFLSASANK